MKRLDRSSVRGFLKFAGVYEVFLYSCTVGVVNDNLLEEMMHAYSCGKEGKDLRRLRELLDERNETAERFK